MLRFKTYTKNNYHQVQKLGKWNKGRERANIDEYNEGPFR